MKPSPSKVIRTNSPISYNYAAIKITQSRIDKGLMAIPAALAGWFPGRNDAIQVYLDDSPVPQTKTYSSYSSSTRECRIGGMKEWFQQNDIKPGDEIVIQLIDKERFIYRLIPEKNFIQKTKELQYSFDNSRTVLEASEKITNLAWWTYLDKDRVIRNEYFRLTNTLETEDREYIIKPASRARESVPTNLRVLLECVYKGHCQVCNFWFIKRDKNPYFEIHHLDPVKGHHPKNIIVVCGNCHNQFEYANVRQVFGDDKWLISVSFNGRMYSVKQIGSKKRSFLKNLFI